IFTLSCRWRGRTGHGCYVHVVESAPVAVTGNPPIGRVDATLTCEASELLELLLGDRSLQDDPSILLSGDRGAFARLLEWLRRVDATATTQPRQSPERALSAA